MSSIGDYSEAEGDPIYLGLLKGANSNVRNLLSLRDGPEFARLEAWRLADASIDTAQQYANKYGRGDSLLESLREKIGL